MEEKKELNGKLSSSTSNLFYDTQTNSQLKQFYKNLKELYDNKKLNLKENSEISQFKNEISNLIAGIFNQKSILFQNSEDKIDLQLFIEYLIQLLELKLSKMVQGYEIFEKMDKSQLLLISKTKSTTISILISFYDFYENELVINNEEIVAEIINKKNTIEDSFIITIVKTINLLNEIGILKEEFTNIFKVEEKKNKKQLLFSKDLGLVLLKIIEFFIRIKNLNVTLNKKKINNKNTLELIGQNNNDQFSSFLSIFFENIIPSLIGLFANVILEYDIKNTISLIIQSDQLNTLLNDFNHIKLIRNKIVNFLCESENLFNKEQNEYITNIVIKNNLLDKFILYINKDINNKYSSVEEFLLEMKNVIKYYLIYNSQLEEIDEKIINTISSGITKINNKNKTTQNDEELFLYFFKEINEIKKEESEQKHKIYNFLIIIFQSSILLRKYIYEIFLNNFMGDLQNYQNMLGYSKFLSIFVGNLWNCEENILEYFFKFLHSFDKFDYFPSLELTNLISSLSCFTDANKIKILMNNLEIYSNELDKINNNKKDISEETSKRKYLIEEMNRNFIDIFSNIMNEIISDSKEKPYKEENNQNVGNNQNKNIFTYEMISPLLEYIGIIIKDEKTYEYLMDKNLMISSLFDKDNKIIVYKYYEILMKFSPVKDINEERINNILNRINLLVSLKDKKNENSDEFEKMEELILILKSINLVIEYDILPDREEESNGSHLNSNKKLKDLIISKLCICFDYFDINKKNIIAVFNDKYHNLIKEYLNIILCIVINSNKNCICKKNINSPDIEKSNFELIINNILALYKLIDENKEINKDKNYFSDLIIFLIDKSLNIDIKQKMNNFYEEKNKLIKEYKYDFRKYYINLFSINENILDEKSYKNIYSNIFIKNPYLIITILNTLNELNIHFLDKYLELIYVLLKINKGNIPILNRHKIITSLLNISVKDNKYNEILYNILELCLPLIKKIDLIIIFEHLIKSYNNDILNFSKEIIQCLVESFKTVCFSPKEYAKGILLSSYEIKQPNIYNLMNIQNIKFNHFTNDSIIHINQEIIFFEEIELSKLILFRIDLVSGSNKNQFIEISIDNGNLIIEEKKNELNFKSNEISLLNSLNINILNSFEYKFNNKDRNLSIIINRKNILDYQFNFSFNQNISRVKAIGEFKNMISRNNNIQSNNILISIGYPLENIKTFSDYKFNKIPYIKILSCSINDEKKGIEKKEFIDIFNLAINYLQPYYNKYSDLTEFKLDENTILISKYNSYESLLSNSIFHRHNIKTQLSKYFIFIDKYLSYSLDFYFRIEKFIFILLNNNNIDKSTFKVLIELLVNYIINNNENMSSFLEKEELSTTLYFVLLKHSEYIDNEIIDILFSSLLSYKNNFLINIFLDYVLFDKLSIEVKNKILHYIISKRIIKGKIDFLKLLLRKLYILLLLCDYKTEKEKEENKLKNVDDSIISIIIGILSKNENNNEILKMVEEILYNLCKFHSMVKEHINKNNKGRKEDTISIITNFFYKLYNSISVVKVKDLFEKKINEMENLNENYKNRLITICNTYKKANLSSSISINFRESTKKIKKFAEEEKENDDIKEEKENRNEDIIIKKEYIKNEEENNNEKVPKLINEFSEKINVFRSGKSTNEEEINNKLKGDSIEESIKNKAWKNLEKKNSKLYEIQKLICMGNCYLCNFIRIILDDLFTRELKFNVYENYMLNNYIETFIFNKKLDYKLQFSHYLFKEEGTSRIRNRFRIKIDKVLNNEIETKRKIEKEKSGIKEDKEKSEYENIFGFYKTEKISLNLCNFFNLGQIFHIDFISDCIDKGDSYQCSYNCLLFQGFNYLNCVFILTEKKIYILTNMILDSDLILYNVSYPINKSFWVVDNYSEMIPEHFKYLDAYDLMNNKLIMKRRFSAKSNNKTLKTDNGQEEIISKQVRGFKLISFNYSKINELHKRRFLHQNNAIEIFLKHGYNYYIAFNKDVRDIVVNKILQNISNAVTYVNKTFITNTSNNFIRLDEITNFNSPVTKSDNMIYMTDAELFIERVTKKLNNSKNKQKNLNKYKNKCRVVDIKEILDQATEKWSYGYIDTYSYIMILNTLSGRTFCDLAQYPVYPWILNDYYSNVIDLKDTNKYRDFSYPIYAQNNESRENLLDKYNSFEDTETKYHSGSHYSNPAFVCYYLVRVKPYSISASEIQGGRFDSPDRLFFNIQKFYNVHTKYQELIPDFFNLPEIYININNFNFGNTLDGIPVDDVLLPPWASNSPRLFSKMNKKALESEYVSQQINNWIDLIFGYKQKGIEAEKSYNVLRDVCSEFNPQKYDDNEEIELKINELCEMGIDPIQLFNKPHPKRERHQVTKAFFGRSAYLTYFGPSQNKYHINNFKINSSIKEINKYYEDSTGVLSSGEGGLSSFRICYEKNNNNNIKKFANKNNDIYYIIGKNKKLLPPSYKNFIEWGKDNSFDLVKPLKNIKFKFIINHMQGKIIKYINITRNRKFLILGYNNGVIEKYVLQKIDESKANIEDNNRNKNEKYLPSISKLVNLDLKETAENNNEKKELKKNIFNSLIKGLKNKINNNSENGNTDNLKLGQKKGNNFIYDTHIAISFSNVLNSDCILLNIKNKKFLQYNSIPSNIFPDYANSYNRIEDYYIYSMNHNEIKNLYKSINENIISNELKKKYIIFLINTSSRIISDIYRIDICESFSFMIVTDKLNKVYLYEFNSFSLIKYIDYSTIFNLPIKYISICPYTGDFIVATKKDIALMNINGVFLSQMSNVKSKINSCFITLIPTTQSDIYLFTAHEDGNLIISKLKTNYAEVEEITPKSSFRKKERMNEEKRRRIKSVKNAYLYSYTNKDNNFKKYLDRNNLPLIFDTVIKIKCSQEPLKFIKLTEDLTEIICIDKYNQLIYLNYSDYFNNKNKDKKNIKECSICKSPINISKVLCHLCGKKLCPKCKIDAIIPEYSLKNKNAICEDCIQLMNSTNKMLYDF